MAYTGFAGDYADQRPRGFSLKRWVAAVFQPVPSTTGGSTEPATRKLYGPLPGDARASGYFGDLDTEVGF